VLSIKGEMLWIIKNILRIVGDVVIRLNFKLSSAVSGNCQIEGIKWVYIEEAMSFASAIEIMRANTGG
jgi:hypothetical protein